MLWFSGSLILFLLSAHLNCRSAALCCGNLPTQRHEDPSNALLHCSWQKTLHTKQHHHSSGPIWLVWTVYLKAFIYYYSNVCSHPPHHHCCMMAIVNRRPAALLLMTAEGEHSEKCDKGLIKLIATCVSFASEVKRKKQSVIMITVFPKNRHVVCDKLYSTVETEW